MKSWRFKNRKNKIGTIMFYIGLIAILLIVIAGGFIIHWALGTLMVLICLTFLGLYLSED